MVVFSLQCRTTTSVGYGRAVHIAVQQDAAQSHHRSVAQLALNAHKGGPSECDSGTRWVEWDFCGV